MEKKLFLSLLLSYFMIGGSFLPYAQEATLLKVGNLRVSADEFAYLYEKNYEDNDSIYMRKHVEEYLDLYINFKLKVAAAYDRGFDTTKAFRGELAGYQTQLAKPYLSDPSITEEIIQEAYDRLKQEVAASHILIRVEHWNHPEDTLKAYNQILEIKEKAENGADFDELAVQYSQDPSAKVNKGYLGYFTSMQMVYAFESAAYQGEKGDLVGPVRTRFGYHLLLVKDKIPARGAVKASHIMVRATQGISKEDSTAAAQKAQSIYDKLQNGGKWDDLCNQFSDDPNTKGKGGQLSWFTTGQMVPSFAEATFNLNEIGSISEPVKTPYGWHIIKLDGKRGIEPLDSMRKKIMQRITRDSRSELSEKRFIAKLKKENNFKEFPVWEETVKAFDKSLTEGKWVAPKPSAESVQPLFQIGNEPFTIQDFYLFVAARQRQNKTLTVNSYAKELYEQYVSQSNLVYEEEHLAEKYPEYRHLLNEYKEGIMLFNIMTEEVWEKAMADSAGLRQYYERQKADYRWKSRAKAVIASVAKEDMLPKIKEALTDSLFPMQISINPLVFEQEQDKLSATHQSEIDRVTLNMRRNSSHHVKLVAYYGSEADKSIAEKHVSLVQKRWEKYNFEPYRIHVSYQKVAEEELQGQIHLNLYSTSTKELEKVYNADSPLNLEIKEGWFEKGEEELLDQVAWEKGEYTTQANGRKVFVQIKETEEPRTKTFDECRGPLIADYQVHLEKEWLKNLKQQYEVEVSKKVLKKLIKKNKKKK